MSDIEINKQRIQDLVMGSPFLQHINFELKSVSKSQFSGTLEMMDFHKQQKGFLHGGVTATLLDVAMGFSCYTILSENAHVVTADLRISYFNPIERGVLSVTGKIEKAGSRLIFCSGELLSDSRVKIAQGTSTMAVVSENDLRKKP
ncbi:MAG: PaaI family thioesterase [Bacteroidota bacterium]